MIDDLEKQIASTLDLVSDKDTLEGGISDRQWTELIKEGLCNLGHSHGYDVSAAGCKGAKTGEWMFDLMWASSENDFFKEMPLVVECEWSLDIDQQVWDFEKLLIAKAQHKLFIFQHGSESEVKNVIGHLSKAIDKFKTRLDGERYMLSGWSGEKKKFIHQIIKST